VKLWRAFRCSTGWDPLWALVNISVTATGGKFLGSLCDLSSQEGHSSAVKWWETALSTYLSLAVFKRDVGRL
jgi:hypothetical protein